MKENARLPMIQSVKTAIEIIELMVAENRPLKFSEIESITKMTKSNLHKYLNTFTSMGLLFRDNEGTYYLGSKLIEFGNAAIGNVNLIELSAPYLKEISSLIKLTTLLSVWTNDGPVIANIWSTNLAINIGAEIGTRLPALSSAGKLYLAFKDKNKVDEWKTRELTSMSANDRKALEKEISKISDTYFSYASEPLVEHVSSFSVPILNYKKDILGSVTIVGFTPLIPGSPEHEISQIVSKKVTELSNTFGYTLK